MCVTSVKAKQLNVTLAKCVIYVMARLILRKRVLNIFTMFSLPSQLVNQCELLEGNDVVIGREIAKNLREHLPFY